MFGRAPIFPFQTQPMFARPSPAAALGQPQPAPFPAAANHFPQGRPAPAPTAAPKMPVMAAMAAGQPSKVRLQNQDPPKTTAARLSLPTPEELGVPARTAALVAAVAPVAAAP